MNFPRADRTSFAPETLSSNRNERERIDRKCRKINEAGRHPAAPKPTRAKAGAAASARATSLTFDPVQPPSPRHALELVNAAILEANFGLRHQILDRARDQDFAGTRFRRDARADV